MGVRTLHVQSRDARLAAFVKDGKERAGIDAAFRAVLRTASGGDLNDQKRLAALQRRLGDALSKRNRARRKRATDRPIVTIVAGRMRSRSSLPGVPPHPNAQTP